MSADHNLVQRCQAGCQEAMRELVERFQIDVYSICVRLLRHSQDAEDVTQEVFLRVFRSLHTWDSIRPLKPWILTIAVNRCRTQLAKRSRLPETTEHVAELPARPIDAPNQELVETIRNGVDALRSDYREVFSLYHEHGRTYEEISEIVDRPVGTVKTWLHRARAQLLELLKARGLTTDELAQDQATIAEKEKTSRSV